MGTANNTNLLSYDKFRVGSAWLIFLLGIGGYASGYFIIDSESIWKEIIIKISDVLVIGVIIGYLSNAAQFLGIFKNDLLDIVYSDKYLSNQKNIAEIWELVSKIMFKSKFPKMSKELLGLIKKYYLSEDEVSYYDNYRVITDIKWASEDRRFVIVQDTITFELVAENKEKFSIPLKTWINIKDLNPDEYYSKVSCSVDEKQVALKITPHIDEKKQEYLSQCDIELEGKTRYEIVQKREKMYCFDYDYDIGFRAKYIVRNLTVTLNHPDDMDVSFICRGTSEDYKLVKKDKTSEEYCYKGLILPRQGYIFALKRK